MIFYYLIIYLKFGIYNSIEINNIDFLKFWIKFNSKRIILNDIYPRPLINLFNKSGTKLKEYDFFKLILSNDIELNKIIKIKQF